MSARSGFDSGQRHTFAAGAIGEFLHERAFAIPDLDVFGKAVHRDEMRERLLDLRDQDEAIVRRRRHVAEDGRLTDGSDHAG